MCALAESIQKRVADPFYGPRGVPGLQSPNAAYWGAWLNRPTAGAGWLTGVKRNRRDTFHNAMETDRPRVLLIPPPRRGIMSPGCIAGFFPTVAWPSEAVRVCDDSITFIQKRVEAPFYGPRGTPGPIKAQTQFAGGLS